MNIEEVQEPETTKIYRQNPLPSVADTRKLRKFTDETNMQARNHENSDEICAQPVRHLDLATPAFYHYRKNPKCYHTVWGIYEISWRVGQGNLTEQSLVGKLFWDTKVDHNSWGQVHAFHFRHHWQSLI